MPDLRTQSVSIGAVSGASLSATVTVRNAGTAPADPFRFDVYQTAPQRWPLSVTLCALTRDQQAAGGSAPCGSPFTVDPLPPRESVTWEVFITWPVDRASGSRETVEFMADGCFATLEPDLPAYCRVNERNETNNIRTRIVTVP